MLTTVRAAKKSDLNGRVGSVLEKPGATDSFTTKQRDDIQGLRALAVISVIAYHMGALNGGFVGVDIFFVISGFLITRLLLKSAVAGGRVNFLDFWTRRARRIVPNAALCLLAVLCFSFLFLPAYRHADIAADVRAAALFIANRHFAVLAVDYFHRNDLPSPILNYWSLAIEEQFYLFWPFAIWLCLRVPKRHFIKAVVTALCLICALSYARCIYTGTIDQAAAFFLTQDRVWQLAVGGLLGTIYPRLVRLPDSLRAAGAWTGLAALAYTLLIFNVDLSYPGYWALMPTFGTAFLILGLDGAALTTPLRRLLSAKPLLWIGDRSFSLYLWHWPVLTFTALYWPDEWFLVPLQIAVTLASAIAAYKFVEDPIRRRSFSGLGRIKMVASAVSALVLLAALGSAVIAFPLPSGGPDRSAAVAAAMQDVGKNYFDDCHLLYNQIKQPPCVYGDTKADRDVVLFGDSHAADWFTPLVVAGKETGWRVHSWTKSSCPSADVTIWYYPRHVVFSECDRWRDEIFAKLRKNPPDLAIISNWWPYHDYLFDRVTHKVIHGGDAEDAEMMRGTGATIRRLNSYGIEVLLIRDTPHMPSSYRDCLAWGASHCGNPRSEALNDADGQGELARRLGKLVDYRDFSAAFCSSTWCPAMKDGMIVYQDAEHTTATFSGTFVAEFRRILRHYADQISAAKGLPAAANVR